VGGLPQSLDSAKKTELSNIAKVITSSLQDSELIAAGAAEIIADQPWIAQAFRAGDRAKLQNGLLPMFERMKSIYGAGILRFFTPPAEALLFVENPKMPITDFRDSRPIVVAANVHGVTQRGLEFGSVGLAVRAIVPIKDSAGLIGAVEYSSDFQVFLKQISAITDTKIAIFVKEDLWKKTRRKDSEFTPARVQVIEGNRAVYSTDWNLTSIAVTAEELEPTRGNRTTTRVVDGAEYGILTMPLMDFSGQQIGFIVCMRNVVELKAAFVDSVRLTVIRMVLGFTLSFGAMIIIFNCLLIYPISDLLVEFRLLSDGKTDKPISTAKRMDEIRALFEMLEQLRLKAQVQSNVISRNG